MTIGSPQAPRIVAVSTASVFDDPTLIRSHWGLPPDDIDTGYQGQLYTRPGDVLVIRVDEPDVDRLAKVATAIDVNRQLWLDLTGIELLSSRDDIVISTSETAIQPVLGERGIFPGSLTDAAVYHFRRTGLSLYAFTCDLQLLQALQFTAAENGWLWQRAHTTSALMNKASAVGVLSVARRIMCPTHSFTADDFDEKIPLELDRRHRYVYKPAGGAAGIGVFAGSGSGATPVRIMQHAEALARDDALPAEFVVQRFVEGTPWGVSGYIAEDGSFSILGIHEQLVDSQHESVGSRWSPAIEERYRQRAEEIFRELSQIQALRGFGAIQLDCIADSVIEINPRLTASAPVHYVRGLQSRIASHAGAAFSISAIDLNTAVDVPFEMIANAAFRSIAHSIRDHYGVLVLPQGLNPFGMSRLVFVNDDPWNTAQRSFIEALLRLR